MTSIKLRGEATTFDRRLDRIPKFDERSRSFPIRNAREVAGKKPRGYTWSCKVWNDQGAEGACVGFGVGHELCARPAAVKNINAKFSREQLYWEAQKIDEWQGGAYPGASPFYEGTSVLAGVKVAHRLGYMESYRWAFGMEDLILGVGYAGPAVIGVNWYSGMFDTDASGFIHVTGRIEGGHCTLVHSVSVKDKFFRIHNSWGRSWGVDGEAKISFADMERLLDEDGEACFFVGRRVKPIPLVG